MARFDQAKVDTFGQSPPKALRRLVLTAVLAALPVLQSCANIPGDATETPPIETTLFAAPQDDLNSVQYQPSFEPDYNHLTPQPWVEPVTTEQQDAVDVYPDRLEFPSAMTEVLAWEAGRVVVAAPSQGAGQNAMGFARRVESVTTGDPKIVVMTSSVAIEDLLQGDMQLQLKPEDARDMDLNKIDLDWAANNLYYNDPDAVSMPGDLLTDDFSDETMPSSSFGKIDLDGAANNLHANDSAAVSMSGDLRTNDFSDKIKTLSFFGKIGKGLGSAGKAVAKVAKQVYVAVTPATFGGSVSLSKKLSYSTDGDLFSNLNYTKSFKTIKGLPAEFKLSGSGKHKELLEFNPGLQLGAKIALPGHNANSQFWLNVDTLYHSQLALDLNFSAALSSVSNKNGKELVDLLEQNSTFSEDALNAFKSQLLSYPENKPAGGWKKTLFVSKPMTNTFFAGPVPVITTTTFQFDLECGFEAKAEVKAKLDFEQNATFKFKVLYDNGTKKTTLEGPTFAAPRRFDAQLTGAGVLSASCGLIPRINVFLYDSVGIFAGIRASLVGKIGYETKCKMETRSIHPTAEATLGLYANVGVQIGARVQAPGSSYLGSKGTAAGYDFGPVEPWSKEFMLLGKTWEFQKGLGFCASLCGGQCGGSCGTCKLGEKCERNSDCGDNVCNNDVCSTDRCGDNVDDAKETDIDCGGPAAVCAARCATGKQCDIGSDCATGFCGSRISATPGICISDHCKDGVLDSDELGIDCGGPTCGKCPIGTKVSAESVCASGIWNGSVCVAATCKDQIKSGDETGPDCGGPSCARRCGFTQGCMASTDCATSAPVCDGTILGCLRDVGMACTSSEQCGNGRCAAGICAPGLSISAMWGADANNIWVAGNAGTIFKWNGSALVPQTSGTTENFRGMWGLNATNVWASGFSGTLLKWDGTSWNSQSSGVTGALRAIWGTDANNVWAVGENGAIVHWNGTAWTAQTSGTTRQLVGMWGADTNNVWVVGAGGTILKRNGSAWMPQTSGTTARLIGVWGTDANNVWTVGDAGTILKWDGAAWAQQTSNTTAGLSAIGGTDANNVWTVGNSGTILKWNGAAWAAQNSGTGRYFASLWVKGANSVFAVEGGGPLLKWNGTAWLEQ